MPISSENKKRYPPNWSEISYSIRERAHWRCEWCGVKDGEIGARIDGEWFKAVPDSDNPNDIPKAGMIFRCVSDEHFDENHLVGFYRKTIRIVLTVAHLDHTPENCDPRNLRALCQQCHNRYDADYRKRNRKIRRILKSGQMDLFERF